MATDFLGRTLNIGDDVFFLNYNGTSANLERGKITKVFPHTAEIGKKRRAEYKIVKILTDVAPVVHGLWIPIRESEMTGWDPAVAGRDPIGGYICSACKEEAVYDCNDEFVLSKYCPNCGAKMDGGDSDALDRC